MFSMCRDPGDTISEISCCVEPSYCFKNRDFDAITKTKILRVVIMLLHKGLTQIHKKPRLHFAESFILTGSLCR